MDAHDFTALYANLKLIEALYFKPTCPFPMEHKLPPDWTPSPVPDTLREMVEGT